MEGMCIGLPAHVENNLIFFTLLISFFLFTALLWCVSQTLNLCQNYFKAAYFITNKYAPPE